MSGAAERIGPTKSGGDHSTPAIGHTIRSRRKPKRLTIPALALRLGRSAGFVGRVERGPPQPPIQDLRRIAWEFDIPLGWFFSHDNAPAAERGYVIRAVNRRMAGDSEADLIERLLPPDPGGSFKIIRTYSSRARNGPAPSGATQRMPAISSPARWTFGSTVDGSRLKPATVSASTASRTGGAIQAQTKRRRSGSSRRRHIV